MMPTYTYTYISNYFQQSIVKRTNMATSLQRAYVGMQCFWGVESSFARLAGVKKTRVGYAGGNTHSPTYYNIGDHTEVTELQFDPALSTYDDILDWFFAHHDPTQRHKKQYQSAVLWIDEQQKESAERALAKANEKWGGEVQTYVKKLDTFYQAEDYHQKYWLRTQSAIFEKLSMTDSELVDSPLAAKINAFLGGFSEFEVLRELQREYNLAPPLVTLVQSIARAGGVANCH